MRTGYVRSTAAARAQGAITQLYSILQFSLRSEGLAEL